MIRNLAYTLPLFAMACTPEPMTLERAEQQCRSEAGLADGIEGRVRIGGGSGGVVGDGQVTITNRVFDPQSEKEFIAACVMRKMAGEPNPTTVGITLGRSL